MFVLIIVILSILFIFQYVKEPTLELCEIENFLTSQQCSELIEWANLSSMTPSYIRLHGQVKIDTDFRGSLSTQMPQAEWPQWYKEKISKYTINEPLVIAKYNTNTQYQAHYDASDMDGKVVMQRPWTLLIYLNDDFEGGETTFVNAKKIIEPKTGKAILFRNLDSKNRTIKNSLHQGNKVTTGEKWIANQWIFSLCE